LKGKDHVVFGTILGVAVQVGVELPMTSLFAVPSYYGGVILGSLLPDIDHPKSYLGRRLYPISVLIHKLFGHRGFTHSLLSTSFIGIIGAVYWASNPLFFGGLLLGYLSHLLGDMFTPRGIPLFYPKRKRYRLVPKAKKKTK
jgi:inner membrane protein